MARAKDAWETFAGAAITEGSDKEVFAEVFETAAMEGAWGTIDEKADCPAQTYQNVTMILIMLNTCDSRGGAAIATCRLHRGLRSIGVGSQLIEKLQECIIGIRYPKSLKVVDLAELQSSLYVRLQKAVQNDPHSWCRFVRNFYLLAVIFIPARLKVVLRPLTSFFSSDSNEFRNNA